MGTKSSKMTVKDAKLETALGSFGCGSCSSSCCISPGEQEDFKDPRLLWIERMVKAEMSMLEHLLLKKMIEHFKEGVVFKELNIKEDSHLSIKVDLENPVPIDKFSKPELKP